MKLTVFFSWQSDTRAAANRTLIHDALDAAAVELRRDVAVGIDLCIDRDTQNTPGTPDIAGTIFAKIQEADVFVADVTRINRGVEGRPTPNPNVLVELGYALRELGSERVILVMNSNMGSIEELPFDLRHRRVLTYSSPEDAPDRIAARRGLTRRLVDAFRLVLTHAGSSSRTAYPATMSMTFRTERKSSEKHEYQLIVTLANDGQKTPKDWHIDVEFPTPLLRPHVIYSLQVRSRSNAKRALFRMTQADKRSELRPGDTVEMSIDYIVDDHLFARRAEWFAERVVATAYLDDQQVAQCEQRMEELQDF